MASTWGSGGVEPWRSTSPSGVEDTPVSVDLAYRPPLDEPVAPVDSFCDTYGVPFGVVLTGDTVLGPDGVSRHFERVVRVPYRVYVLLS